ncbi:MAG TPA: hypothetical protein DDZ70_00615 [Firmicutes bacterium]|nr:hypothetical protein [Bacillota bacterium]
MGTMTGIRKGAKRYLKGIVLVLIVALLAGGFYLGIGNRQYQSSQGLYKGPSASVNGVKIKDEDFNRALNQTRNEFYQYGAALSEELIHSFALENAINNQIMLNAQKDMKIAASNAEVNAFMDQMHKAYDTEEEWSMLLYQTGAGSERELRGMVRESIVYLNLLNTLAKEKGLTVEEQEIIDAYQSVDASHILIRVKAAGTDEEGHTEAEARQLANEIYEQLKAGADFVALANEKTEDPSGQGKGGALGTFVRGQMVPEFEEAAFALPAGEISEPVKTNFGYHIIKVNNRVDPESEEFQSKKADYEKNLLAQKFEGEHLNTWIEEQRSQATIDILDPAFRAFRLKGEEKWPEAALAYEKAIKNDKDNQGLYLSLKEVYVRDNRLADAAKLMETARKKWPENTAVLTTLADVYALQKDTAKTGEVLAYTSSIAGDDVAMHQEIKALYEKAEMTAEAAEEQIIIETLAAQQATEQTGADITGDISADETSTGSEGGN